MNFELMIEEAVEKAVEKALAKASKPNKPAKATKNSKKTKGSKTKKAPTYERVELPEGWELIAGMQELKKSAYKKSRDGKLTKHEPWGFHNRAGYLAVQEALA